MLNLRLYRTCWLVAGVALVVALLTLQTPEAGPEPSLPSTIDGQGTLELSQQLAAIAPDRPPGSAHDLAAARWVQGQLAQVPGAAGKVRVQDLEARANGERVSLQNVYLAVPGTDNGRPMGGILVVAPRDTPADVEAGTTSTAVMLRLAQASGTTRHQRPHLFVSTDGSTLGNAGLRWFLHRFSSFPLTAAIVLDAPGEANGDRVHVWIDGRTGAQALGLGNIADRSVTRAGGRSDGPPSLGGQLLRLGVPQTFGDQGAAIADGLTAVTLSARSESPLREGRPPTAERLEMVANAANDLLGTLDVAETVPAADGGLSFAGKFLRPTIARLTLLLLMLPVLVCALDILSRQRRARVPIREGLRAVGLRAVPLFAALGAAYLLALGGLLPGAAAGEPPIPANARFGALAGLAIVGAALAGVLGWVLARRRARRLGASPAAEAAAALAALSVLLIVLWIVRPYALVLAIPAAHAALLATSARRPWHLPALAALAVVPFVILVVSVSQVLHANVAFTVWYLMDTSANGSRGAVGLFLGLLVAACILSLTALVIERAAKGRLALPRRRGRPPRERPAAPRPPEAGAGRW